MFLNIKGYIVNVDKIVAISPVRENNYFTLVLTNTKTITIANFYEPPISYVNIFITVVDEDIEEIRELILQNLTIVDII